MRAAALLSVALLSIAQPGLAVAAETPFLRLAQAEAMAATAERTAQARGGSIAIVIVNAEGRVVLSHRMDKVSFLNLSVAESKAVTAAGLGAPTSDVQKEVTGGSLLLLTVPGVTAIAGGVPVVRGGKIVGAVGVSGGAPEEDERLAKAVTELPERSADGRRPSAYRGSVQLEPAAEKRLAGTVEGGQLHFLVVGSTREEQFRTRAIRQDPSKAAGAENRRHRRLARQDEFESRREGGEVVTL